MLSFGEFAIMWHAVGEEFAGDDELGLVEQAFKFFDTDGGGTIEKGASDLQTTKILPIAKIFCRNVPHIGLRKSLSLFCLGL